MEDMSGAKGEQSAARAEYVLDPASWADDAAPGAEALSSALLLLLVLVLVLVLMLLSACACVCVCVCSALWPGLAASAAAGAASASRRRTRFFMRPSSVDDFRAERSCPLAVSS